MTGKLAQLLEAASFAAERHSGQRRKGLDRAPYINHPLEVASLLATVGAVEDFDILIAAILHDTVEDTATAESEIEQKFGRRVAAIVIEVTDDMNLEKQERKERQVMHAPRMSDEAKQLKMCDKISNITDIVRNPPSDWSREQQIEYIEWGERVFAGLRGVNSNLELYFDSVVAEAKALLESR